MKKNRQHAYRPIPGHTSFWFGLALVLVLLLLWLGHEGLAFGKTVPGLFGREPVPALPAGAIRAAELSPEEAGNLCITVLDVGQGDCSLVRLPSGELLLVDGGDLAAGPRVRQWLTETGLTNIAYLVATHPHADHIGGLPEIMKALNIGQVYLPAEGTYEPPSTRTYRDFLKALMKKGLQITDALAGEVIASNALFCCRFLAPENRPAEDLNAASACVLINFGKHSALLAGDAPAAVEKEMLHGYPVLRDGLTFLKVAHHGSRTSSCLEFLKAVQPENAVISLGAGNSYGHPHRETLERLQNWCGAVYRTDQEGIIEFVSDGQEYEIRSSRLEAAK